jgi:hypothetical protein
LDMAERAPQRRREGGTGRCVGGGGHVVKLREGAERLASLGKGAVAMRCYKKERGSVQRKRALVLNTVAVRDYAGGMEADTAFTEGEPELHAHKRVVEAHRGRCVGVCGKIEIDKGCVLTAVWSLARGPSARGGRTTREKCVRRRWRERERRRNLDHELCHDSVVITQYSPRTPLL